jgi:hypothetical protein
MPARSAAAACPAQACVRRSLRFAQPPNRSFNLNFFAHPVSRQDDEVAARTRARLKPFYEELGIGEVPSVGSAPFEPFGAEALAIVLEERPRVVAVFRRDHASARSGCALPAVLRD